ncbi:hypothetical protein MPER_08479 [Moniliophthora perniciosa FA553]|nr:hypothetical protein MPER_08479 [Moniliophthora perniciosa FA553]
MIGLAHYGEDVYDLLSAAFDDPSATIVYTICRDIEPDRPSRPLSTTSSRAISPHETASSASASRRNSSPGRPETANGQGGYPPPSEEPDPDAQLLTIIGHISSETTGALHKEGITELHQFLKAYPHKRPRVEKMLESTGAAFRKYINRALASRAAEDEERNVAVADTLSKLESTRNTAGPVPSSPVTSEYTPHSPRSHLEQWFITGKTNVV